MVKTTHGIVHGKLIELDQDLGIADGQQVEVQVKVIATAVNEATQWGEGLRRCAGALADEWTEEDDRILQDIHEDRNRDSRPEIVE